MRLISSLAIAFAALAVAACGSDSGTASPPPHTTTTAVTTTTTAEPAVRPKPAPKPVAEKYRAAARAICAEPFYASAFSSVAECESKMANPKAIEDLRKSVENYGKTTP